MEKTEIFWTTRPSPIDYLSNVSSGKHENRNKTIKLPTLIYKTQDTTAVKLGETKLFPGFEGHVIISGVRDVPAGLSHDSLQQLPPHPGHQELQTHRLRLWHYVLRDLQLAPIGQQLV